MGVRLYRDLVLADRPTAYWPFDSGREQISGTVGTVHSCTFEGPGIPGDGGGRSLTLPSSGAYYDTGMSSSALLNPTAFTLELWAKFSSINTSGIICAKGSDLSGDEWLYQINEGGANGPFFLLQNTSAGANYTYAAGIAAPTANNKWHHMIAWFNGNNPAIPTEYLDGVQQALGGSQALTGTRQTSSAKTVTVGAYNNGSTPVGIGQFAHLAFYNYILSPARILAHYQFGMGLVARTPRDELRNY